VPDQAALLNRVFAALDDFLDRDSLVLAEYRLPRFAIFDIEKNPLQGVQKSVGSKKACTANL